MTGPGTAMTGRPRAAACVAVFVAPDRAAASTTTTPVDRAAINRLRVRKRRRCGAQPGGLSEINRPSAATASNNCALPGG